MWLGHFGASAGVVERTRAVADSAPLKLTYQAHVRRASSGSNEVHT